MEQQIKTTEKAGEKMKEKEKPEKTTDMEGVRLVAKGLPIRAQAF